MKAKIKSSDFNKALKLASNAIEVKDLALSNVQFVAEEDKITVSASNSVFSILINCPADVDEDGIAVVDGKMAYSVVSKATGDCIITSDDRSVFIKTNGRTKLPNVNKELKVISSAEGNTVKCDSVAFKNAINKVAYAISEDQTRLILTGAHIVTDGNEMTITALDGFRLAQTSIICSGDAIDIVVPSRVLTMLCDAITTGDLVMQTNKTHLTIDGASFTIHAITLSGDYIDTNRIIPTTFKTNALVKTADMKDLADSATVASGSSNLVKLEVGDERIVVKSNSEEADFNGDVNAMIDGDPLVIAFNLRYLIQALNRIDTEFCEIRFNSPVSPAIISNHNEGVAPDINLILPVRVFN